METEANCRKELRLHLFSQLGCYDPGHFVVLAFKKTSVSSVSLSVTPVFLLNIFRSDGSILLVLNFVYGLFDGWESSAVFD